MQRVACTTSIGQLGQRRKPSLGGVRVAFKKYYWKDRFQTLPQWPCPNCAPGKLVPIDESKFEQETGPSKNAHGEDEWDPEWIVERFSIGLRCVTCGDIAVVTGNVKHELDYGHDHEGETTTTVTAEYFPETFHPAPSVIDLPEKTPEDVSAQIERASALIWLDEGSCANRLRAATEMLLTELNIPRYTTNKYGKRVALNLDSRINKLKTKNDYVANLLHSLRWIGNVGSHGSFAKIARDDLLSAFEIMEHVLEKLFDNKEQRLTKAAKDITKRKGQKEKPTRRRTT